jgi:hypothetical protein
LTPMGGDGAVGQPNGHVQARSTSSADLPPLARFDRGALSIVVAATAVSHYASIKPVGVQEIRPHDPPLPHRENQSRPTNFHRRRPATGDLRDSMGKIKGQREH